jgi:hypothetical protein
MNDRRLRFSLRTLFAATTLIAVLIPLSIAYPDFVIGALVLAFPLLFAAAMAFLANHVIILARAILVILGTAFLIPTVYGCIEIMRGSQPNWFSMMLVGGFGLYFYFVAWTIGPTIWDDAELFDAG